MIQRLIKIVPTREVATEKIVKRRYVGMIFLITLQSKIFDLKLLCRGRESDSRRKDFPC